MSATEAAVTFWDDVHAARPQAASPRPNARLVETAADLPPGDALDLGCGNGGDALWLAGQGWRVTAVDLSAVAVGRLTERAAGAGLGEQVSARRHDLSRSFPAGRFDLVTSHYLHTPYELDRARSGENTSELQ